MRFLATHWRDIISITWKVGAGLIFIITALGFACFIQEEAIQARGMSLYILTSNKLWAEARAIIIVTEPAYRRDLARLRRLAHLNILTGKSFLAFVEATETHLEITKKVVEIKLRKKRKLTLLAERK